MDRFTAISLFVRSVELGSFSAAGAAVGMPSQVVGKQIAKLENHLGVKLLSRTTRRQSLTDFGKSFYDRAKIILAELEIAESMAEETKLKPTGRLRISAPMSFGMYKLSRRLPDFMKMHPSVLLDLSLSNRAVDLIEEGYDIVFRVGELAPSGLIARKLTPHRFVLCASPSYLKNRPPIRHPSDLEHCDCLTYSQTELRNVWTFGGMADAVSVPVNGKMIVDHGEPLLQAAIAGLGVMLQPYDIVEDHLASGHLVHLLPEWEAPSRPLHVLYAADRRLPPKMRAFLDFAIAEFA